MKKLIFASLLLLLLPLSTLFAQINLEADYEYSGTYTQLASSGYKFFIMDVTNKQCRVFNTDHTLWKTINLNVPSGHYLYDIRYVSENLFTNDNTLSLAYIYYFYDEINQYYTYTLKIINEDGTDLRTIAGAQYLNVVSLGEGGTKMLAYVYDYSLIFYTITTVIYDLPGQLVSSGSSDMNELSTQNAFPNPASDYTIIPYTLPENSNTGVLKLSDANGKLIKSFTVDQYFKDVRINTTQLPRGIYFYHLEAGNYRSEAGKIVVK